MSIFNFNKSNLLGTVREVDARRASIFVKSENLTKACVGHLVACQLNDGRFVIGIIEKITKALVKPGPLAGIEIIGADGDMDFGDNVPNSVRLVLIGTLSTDGEFSRSLIRIPDIDSECWALEDEQLDVFMNIISRGADAEHSLVLGDYSIAQSPALLDGNKFFQRHAALLGSTGSGKSWTVTSVLERASKLPTSNLIVFDMHGEYGGLSYARHLRIPGPEELGSESPELLFLPYWLLTAEEMQSMFIDVSEFTAHNQTPIFRSAIVNLKRATLLDLGDHDVLEAFTLDSPIPFDIQRVVENLRSLDEEMVEGARGAPKKGPFNGQFTRLLERMKAKLEDRRYGFLFQAPPSLHQYAAMAEIVSRIMDFTGGKNIKVIDFSDVPSDVLPVIIGLVARLIYGVQFWTPPEQRRPLAMVCDEAHLYLPSKAGHNPVERRAIENFERISKEGRKYGVSLVIVSQRPADVNQTILAQANNVVSLRLTNGDDQAIVKRLMPESLAGLVDALPVMDIGEAIVVGDAVLIPSRIRITPPTEAPRSATIDFWSRWQESVPSPDFNVAVENMRRQGRGRRSL